MNPQNAPAPLLQHSSIYYFTAITAGPTCAVAVSKQFHDHVIDQLRRVPSVTSRAMFGGFTIYSKGVAFAIIDNDRLYFKTNDTNRADYTAAGMQPWDPYGDGRVSFSNYELPEAIFENADELALWAAKAIAVARSKKKAKPAKKLAKKKPTAKKRPVAKRGKSTGKAKKKK